MARLNAPKKILFMSEAVSLAHVGRPLALASALDPNEYEIHFATGETYKEFLARYPFTFHTITSLPHATFQERIRRGKALYDKELLALQIQEDLALIAKLQPDVIVGDFRLSLGISARVARVPYCIIANAHWNPLSSSTYPVPDIPPLCFLPLPLAQLLFDSTSPRGFLWHVAPHNAMRTAYGLPLLPHTVASVYTDADRVLYADLPELFPNEKFPPHHSFIGPVLWSPRVDTPPALTHIPHDKPLIYFGLGTSGNNDLMPKLFDVLGTLPITVIASTAGKLAPKHIPPNVFPAPYVNGQAIMDQVDLMISNGGTGTTYQALAAGKPILGIASNLDQLLTMKHVVDAGAGLLLRAGRIHTQEFSRAVMNMLRDPTFKRNADVLREAFPAHDSAHNFSRIIEDLLGGTRR